MLLLKVYTKEEDLQQKTGWKVSPPLISISAAGAYREVQHPPGGEVRVGTTRPSQARAADSGWDALMASPPSLWVEE